MTWALPIIAVVSIVLVVFEFRRVRQRRLRRAREAAWPQFEEVVISALESGIPVAETFSYAQEFAIPEFRDPLNELVAQIDRGVPLAAALTNFAQTLDIGFADLFVEVVELSNQFGAQNLVSSLREHVESVRYELAAAGDVEARNGAVLTVAKLGLLAPWVLVGLLSFNASNRLAFETSSGGLLLLGGFAISLLAFRLVTLAGTLPPLPRVFERARF